MNNHLTANNGDGARVDNARRFFHQPDRYLKGNYRIPLRIQIVRDLVGELSNARILDLGCGDGSISAPFLRANNHLTLVDYSSAMLERARSHIPPECQSRTEYVHGDILAFEPAAPYDLVICIGVLSHVDSIDRAIETVAKCVKPGGRAVVQLTDDDDAFLRLSKWAHLARNTFSRTSMRSHAMTLSEVVAILGKHQLEVTGQRRHLLLLFPGMAGLLGKWLVPYDTFTQRHEMLAKHGSNVILVCRKPSLASARWAQLASIGE